MDKQMPLLWQMMQSARDATIASNHPFATDEQLMAAEIRAVSAWLLQLPNGYGWAEWQAKAIAKILDNEASRAEQGEVENA